MRKRIRDEAATSVRKGAFLRAASPTTVLHEYAVAEDEDPSDLRVVKAANPLKTITIPMLKRKQDHPRWCPRTGGGSCAGCRRGWTSGSPRPSGTGSRSTSAVCRTASGSSSA